MKIEVKVNALSFANTTNNSCLVVLLDVNINRRLPIVINPSDAQFVAVKFNKINISKPMTPDVFKLLMDVYQVDIQEVYIHKYENGVFHARIISTNGVETCEIECSVSTGLIMSSLYECPIYIESEIMDKESIHTDEEGNLMPVKKNKMINGPKIKIEKLETESISSLNEKLEEAVQNEDFEEAVKLRDKIGLLSSKKSKK